MPVNQSELKFFAELEAQAAENPKKSLAEQSIDEFRTQARVFSSYAGTYAELSNRKITIFSRDGYQLRAQLFNDTLPNNTSTLIMFPGCGYVLDLFEANAIAASRIAQYAQCKVILVDFRLALEHHLAVCLNDGYDAVLYLLNHRKELKLNFDRLIIAGMSSGAHCAATIANVSRKIGDFQVNQQILISGCFDLTDSYHEYDNYEAEDKLCTSEAKKFLFSQYGLTTAELADPHYSPSLANDFKNFPDTTFIVGEYDGLRNHSEYYYKKLKSAGIRVEKIVLPGQTHNTFLMREVMTEAPDPARIVADVIKKT